MEDGAKRKSTLMDELMKTFVGNGFYLILKQGVKYLIVNSIGIIQKTDESCPMKEVPIGGFFFQLAAINEEDQEAFILCNWSEEFIQNLLENYGLAKNAGCKEILVCKDSALGDSDNWSIVWGNEIDRTLKPVSVEESSLANRNYEMAVAKSYIC